MFQISSVSFHYMEVLSVVFFLLFATTVAVAAVRSTASNTWEANKWIKIYRTRRLALIFLLLAIATLIASIFVRLLAPIS